MPEEKITIKIDKNGKVTADAENFEGKACLEEIEKILDGFPPIDDVKYKKEYYIKKDHVKHKVLERN